MDMFMDKLAQRLNAQEIIRANTAAELEELDKLKDRVAEYNECLDRLQLLISENAAGLRGASEANAAQIQNLAGKVLETVNARLDSIGGELSGRLDQLTVQPGGKQEEGLEEKFAATDENVHRECVKVYRNVQAVVVGESGRQAETLASLSAKLDAVKVRMGFLLGISVIAMLSSLALAALQIMAQLNIKLF